MSRWTYVHGTITVRPMGRTQAEKRYILETVLDHLPVVTGSEGDMDVYIVQPKGYESSSSCDEFGNSTNNLFDRYNQKSRRNGWLKIQEEYILVLDGSLRDRMFEETFKEFQNWICRLAKRVGIEDVFVEIKAYEKSVVIHNENDAYGKMFETPSWRGDETHSWKLSKKLKQYHLDEEKDFPEPNWCEYLMWERMDDCMYPKVLGYKYFNDEDNDKKVEDWIFRESK